jgi:hypothetical protein
LDRLAYLLRELSAVKKMTMAINFADTTGIINVTGNAVVGVQVVCKDAV